MAPVVVFVARWFVAVGLMIVAVVMAKMMAVVVVRVMVGDHGFRCNLSVDDIHVGSCHEQ